VTIYSSCENDLRNDIEKNTSKIWVNAVIGTNDTIRIFLGTTSGMNSGDIARYRDDATVMLKINSFKPKLLEFKKESGVKGYYFADRFEHTKPGDSLSFTATVSDDNFEEVSSSTYIPNVVDFDAVLETYQDIENIGVDLEIFLDDENSEDKFFQLKMKNYKYFDQKKTNLAKIADISIANSLEYPYGFSWNEKLKSFLIDQSKLDSDSLKVHFLISDDSQGNNLNIELRTITKDYYRYRKALDNGSVSNSNITNGVGIFAGYSSTSKMISIK